MMNETEVKNTQLIFTKKTACVYVIPESELTARTHTSQLEQGGGVCSTEWS